jgi:hypothetical protein
MSRLERYLDRNCYGISLYFFVFLAFVIAYAGTAGWFVKGPYP